VGIETDTLDEVERQFVHPDLQASLENKNGQNDEDISGMGA
jgi:hypothetical protein